MIGQRCQEQEAPLGYWDKTGSRGTSKVWRQAMQNAECCSAQESEISIWEAKGRHVFERATLPLKQTQWTMDMNFQDPACCSN